LPTNEDSTDRLMKILFSSYTFSPNVGGIESVSAILAEKFAGAGHEVELITETPGEKIDQILSDASIASPQSSPSLPLGEKDAKRQREQGRGGCEAPGQSNNYRITRRPSFWELFRRLFWCDLLFQNNISVRSLLPALLLKKRVIVVHQTWLRSVTGRVGWNNRIKRALLPRVTNVAISEAVLDHIQVPARVIGNPYDDRVFRLLDNVVRDKTLVFLGRLVSDKGADLLLHALKILHDDGLEPDLTIIGSGPEKNTLHSLTRQLDLDQQVTFAGPRCGPKLAELLNRHHILVVPSRWPEPFGIVALEGIACGCVVVGSSAGGLKEAIGPCGLTFENGNERALAACLKSLLLDPKNGTNLREQAAAHLAKFRSDAVASAYLELMEKIAS
jgi:glycogen(starch) synthase